jgi:hypothetical protein
MQSKLASARPYSSVASKRCSLRRCAAASDATGGDVGEADTPFVPISELEPTRWNSVRPLIARRARIFVVGVGQEQRERVAAPVAEQAQRVVELSR